MGTVRFRAHVRVAPKPTISDPEGDTIAEALGRLGFKNVESLRSGKYFDVVLDAADTDSARESVRQMCEKLLANPVIERFEFGLEPAD